MTIPVDLQAWRTRLATIGRAGLVGTPLHDPKLLRQEDLRSFRDLAGQSHPAHDLMLCRLLGREALTAQARESTPDTVVWLAIGQYSLFSKADIAPKDGPLWPALVREGIEAWTLMELRGLHALWWVGLLHDKAELCERALAAATWHVEELQPDNATNRPWAIHVFLSLAERTESPEALHFAQTLLHNAMMTGGGKPEVISAAILLDASEGLR